MYFEYARRIPEVIRWLIRHPSCQSPDLAAPCAAIPGGLKSFRSLYCSVVLAFTPRFAHSKGPTILGGHTFPHFTHRSLILSITGGLSLPRCSFSSGLSVFAPPAITTAKPTTGRFSLTHRRAQWVKLRGATIVAKPRSLSSSRMFTAIFSTSRFCSSFFFGRMPSALSFLIVALEWVLVRSS